jgi:hypothetical protein
MTVENSLFGLRLAITLPPPHFFGGTDRKKAVDSADALRRLGATVYGFETDSVYRRDHAVLARQIETLRAFQPDAVIAASNAGYALEADLLNEKGPDPHTQRNLFLDVLGVPVIFYWDQVIPQLSRYIAAHWPSHPVESAGGVLNRMRGVMTHRNAVHFVPDTGHITRLQKLGIGGLSAESWMVTSVPMAYVEHGDQHAGIHDVGNQLAFFGNLYLAAAKGIDYGQEIGLLRIRDRALAAARSDWSLAPYDAYVGVLDSIDNDERSRFHLDPDQTFYWRFLFNELSVVANGDLRLHKMTVTDRPICYFGGFADPQSRELVKDIGWIVRESLPYGEALAPEYRNTCISIDVANAPFINGFSPKLLECFAAGGFMLSSKQADAASAIGDLSDAIGFSSAEELSAKIDRFLTRDRERHEVSREIREIIRREYTASALLSRTVPIALERIRSRNVTPKPPES